jgi:hypothetical protein
MKGEWIGFSAGGCRNHRTFKNNPQYHIVVTGQSDDDSVMDTTDTELTILLSQTEKTDFNPLGFYVVKVAGILHISQHVSFTHHSKHTKHIPLSLLPFTLTSTPTPIPIHTHTHTLSLLLTYPHTNDTHSHVISNSMG